MGVLNFKKKSHITYRNPHTFHLQLHTSPKECKLHELALSTHVFNKIFVFIVLGWEIE